MYMAVDKIFNYFASYQVTNKSGAWPEKFINNNQLLTKTVDLGLKTMMMSPMDFYAAITPDCSTHGVGAGVHVNLTDVEVKEGKYYSDKSPLGKSILNEVGKHVCEGLGGISTRDRFYEWFSNYDEGGGWVGPGSRG